MSNAEFWNQRFIADAQKTSDNAVGHATDTVTGKADGVFAGEPNPVLKEMLSGDMPQPPHNRAIDLGSGRGRHTVWLAREGWDATAFDFSDVGLEHTREALGALGLNATLTCGDLTTWNPGEGSYDLVLCAYIHMMPQQRAELWAAIDRAIAPGGHLALIAHHPDNSAGGPPNPALLYGAEEVIDALGAGYVIKQGERLERGGGAVDCVVYAQKLA